MRYFVILLVVGVLAGCAPQTVMLEHPDTGMIVQCGPFETLMEESQCLNDFHSQGYERIQGDAIVTAPAPFVNR